MIVDIDGLPVYFPYEIMHPEQKSYISYLLSVLKQSGQCLLEMPSGTGKTISILSATISYHIFCKKRDLTPPKILYCSRTLTEIEKALGELKSYYEYLRSFDNLLSHNFLGLGLTSRSFLCVNDVAKRSMCSIEHACHSLILSGADRRCEYFVNLEELGGTVSYRRLHAELDAKRKSSRIGAANRCSNSKSALNDGRENVSACDQSCATARSGLNHSQPRKVSTCSQSMSSSTNTDSGSEKNPNMENRVLTGVYTLSDLKQLGKERVLCPYYLARHYLQQADIVIFPYNYVIDPRVRNAVLREVSRNSVVIFDEAHNIDNACIEALSVEIKRSDLDAAKKELVILDSEIRRQKIENFRILEDERAKLRESQMRFVDGHIPYINCHKADGLGDIPCESLPGRDGFMEERPGFDSGPNFQAKNTETRNTAQSSLSVFKNMEPLPVSVKESALKDNILQHGALEDNILQHGAFKDNIPQHSTLEDNIPQHSTLKDNILQHGVSSQECVKISKDVNILSKGTRKITDFDSSNSKNTDSEFSSTNIHNSNTVNTQHKSAAAQSNRNQDISLDASQEVSVTIYDGPSKNTKIHSSEQNRMEERVIFLESKHGEEKELEGIVRTRRHSIGVKTHPNTQIEYCTRMNHTQNSVKTMSAETMSHQGSHPMNKSYAMNSDAIMSTETMGHQHSHPMNKSYAMNSDAIMSTETMGHQHSHPMNKSYAMNSDAIMSTETMSHQDSHPMNKTDKDFQNLSIGQCTLGRSLQSMSRPDGLETENKSMRVIQESQTDALAQIVASTNNPENITKSENLNDSEDRNKSEDMFNSENRNNSENISEGQKPANYSQSEAESFFALNYDFAPGSIRNSVHFLSVLRRCCEYLRTKLKTTHRTCEPPASFVSSLSQLTLVDRRVLSFLSTRLGVLSSTLCLPGRVDLPACRKICDLLSLAAQHTAGFAVLYTPFDDLASSVFAPTLRLACLDGGIALQGVLSLQTVVITSGTLSPLHLYARMLGLSRATCKQVGIVLRRNAISPLIVTKGNDQMTMRAVQTDGDWSSAEYCGGSTAYDAESGLKTFGNGIGASTAVTAANLNNSAVPFAQNTNTSSSMCDTHPSTQLNTGHALLGRSIGRSEAHSSNISSSMCDTHPSTQLNTGHALLGRSKGRSEAHSSNISSSMCDTHPSTQLNTGHALLGRSIGRSETHSSNISSMCDTHPSTHLNATNTDTSQRVSSSYSLRNDPSVIRNYGLLVLELTRVVPDGMVIFFPSYIYMEEIATIWSESGLTTEIQKQKLIFIETPQNDETAKALELYKHACDTGRGAILFAIARGKVSEGVDFAGAHGRCAVLLGVPFQYTESLQLKKRMEFLENKVGIRPSEFLNFDAMRQAAQCLGRVLRNKNDYGLMIMADYRFEKNERKDKLPQWIINCIETAHTNLSIDMAICIAKRFFREMAQPLL